MSKINKLSRRFMELLFQADAVIATKHYVSNSISSGDYVDREMYLAWKTKAKHLLSLACGEFSPHAKAFQGAVSAPYSTNYQMTVSARAVLEAAQEDYDGGYFSSVRNLVQAEVFSDELDQASELLKAGYKIAAAVIAGVVLETNLRRMCADNSIVPASLNRMNDDLTKAGVYSLLVKKQIIAWADIRNNAAHGRPNAFDESDVSDMIAKVSDFITAHMS